MGINFTDGKKNMLMGLIILSIFQFLSTGGNGIYLCKACAEIEDDRRIINPEHNKYNGSSRSISDTYSGIAKIESDDKFS
jgi:hypothetical protein